MQIALTKKLADAMGVKPIALDDALNPLLIEFVREIPEHREEFYDL